VEDMRCSECEENWTGEWEDIEKGCWNLGDVMEIDGGEAPGWRENVKGGYKIKMVTDSGACKTIVPPNTLPKMKIVANKDARRNFRATNGKLFPHLGETKLQGKSQGGGSRTLQHRWQMLPSHWQQEERLLMLEVGLFSTRREEQL